MKLFFSIIDRDSGKVKWSGQESIEREFYFNRMIENPLLMAPKEPMILARSEESPDHATEMALVERQLWMEKSGVSS